MKLTKKHIFIIKLLLLISWPVLGLLMPIDNNPKILLINSIIIFFTTLILVIRVIKIDSIKRNCFLISFIVSCYTYGLFLSLFAKRIQLINNLIINYTHIESLRFVVYSVFAILIFPPIIFCIYWFIDNIVPIIIKELKTITKVEKKYLIITTIIGGLLVIITSFTTTAFQIPNTHKEAIDDIIYTADNGYLSSKDAWTNLEHRENDIRQPLFAVFSLPFSIPCHIISEFMYFVPKEYSYLTTMGIFQFIILALTNIMLARLINLKEEDKIYYYIFTSLTYPFILFGIVLEQYVISLFYLIATIYYYFNNREKINYLYIGAVGTTITSGVLLSYITQFKGHKDWLKKTFKCFISFMMVLILSGQFAQIFSLQSKISNIARFTGRDISNIEKIQQFTHFIKSLFIPPTGIIRNNFFDVISYQVAPHNTICIFGIVILILAIISSILNWKNKISHTCIFWIFISFVILVLVGWGSFENGQILYSLYFAWAYYTLIFLLIYKIKNKKISRIIIIIITSVLLFTAIRELINIYSFALKYYIR